jgi:hypothetical protein
MSNLATAQRLQFLTLISDSVDFAGAVLPAERQKCGRFRGRMIQQTTKCSRRCADAEDRGGIFGNAVAVGDKNPPHLVPPENCLCFAADLARKKRTLASIPARLSCELPATVGWPDQ